MLKTRRKAERKADGPEAERLRLKELVHFSLFTLLVIGLISFQIDLSQPFFIELLSWGYILADGLVVAILFTFLALYLRLRKPELVKEGRLKAFIAGLIILMILVEKAASLFSPYLVPVAFGTALVAIFFGPEIGLIMNLILAILVGLGKGIVPEGGLVAFAGGMTALFGVQDLRRRGDLALAGVGIGIANMLMLFGVSSASGFESLKWNALVWAGVNGLISYLLIMGGIPICEYLTEKTSPVGLMELLNPTHPLLERLQKDAPGTYHHSSNVAKLGANAARAIGADPLLTEVGGYYHDIGKLDNPEYFAENQESGENPHDEISPSMSKIVITTHVKKGERLGREYGLRKDVLRFIPEHHGTSVIRYFYFKALQERREAEVNRDDFRYEAALPRTKETAIIMLADAVEAASRVLENGARIEEMVEETIRDKLEDGQLNRSPLTIADLNKIKQAFCETLRAMRHWRPEDFPKS